VAARFFAPSIAEPGELIDLPREEAEHLTRVLRLAAGATIRVFDGHGHECVAVVEEVSRGGARVRVDRMTTPAAEPALAVTLVQAVLKGDKMDDIVRDAVMMGAGAIRPLISARTEASAAGLDRGRRVERWQRIAVASAKQCGRAVIPAIGSPQAIADAVREIGTPALPGPALMLVEPGASADAIPLRDLAAEPPEAVTLLIGPEGGWTPEEVALGSTACRLVSLGGLTLRADAAPIIALSALFTRWNVY
jgi:16S rRNA (uracil1498-N3)-methyltransferase